MGLLDQSGDLFKLFEGVFLVVLQDARKDLGQVTVEVVRNRAAVLVRVVQLGLYFGQRFRTDTHFYYFKFT